MQFEAEVKFPIADPGAVRRRLEQLGTRFYKSERQCDWYFAHPSRDFAQTDEALRVRLADESAALTYKGPRIDATTKTRRELELALPPPAADTCRQILQALGFRLVAEVRKQREHGQLSWQGASVHVCLDEVDRLGWFVELELLADAAGVDEARESLMQLAETLQLTGSERRSYLELLLQHCSAGDAQA